MPLREAWKEIVHLVNENHERPIFWTYSADGAVPNVPVTYNCKDKAVEQILDELFRPHGLGFTTLSGDDHRGVIVCDRESGDGRSRLQRLPEIDGYAAAMAEGRLGDVVARGRLPLRPEERDYSDFDRLMGIG